MLTLLRILFDIIRLRKGPDAVPRSFVLFFIVVTMWLAAVSLVFALVEELNQINFAVVMLTTAIGLASYCAVIISFGQKARLLQSMTSVIGCGALIEIMFVASNLVLSSLIGEKPTILVTTLILLWSIPVDGHILSRAINRHWYFGIVVAMIVFILQYSIGLAINPLAPQTS